MKVLNITAVEMDMCCTRYGNRLEKWNLEGVLQLYEKLCLGNLFGKNKKICTKKIRVNTFLTYSVMRNSNR